MRFDLEQRFTAPLDAVEAAFVDRALLAEVGGKVERAIVSGLRDHAAAEAGVVQAWLDRRARASGTT